MLFDRDGAVRSILGGPAGTGRYGVTRREAVGRTPHDFVGREDADRVVAAMVARERGAEHV